MGAHHSLQNRNVICSMFFFESSPALDAGEAMIDDSSWRPEMRSRGIRLWYLR